MAAKLTPEYLFYNYLIALRIVPFLSLEDWLNVRLVCRQWYKDLSQPILLKDPFAQAEESLCKELIKWLDH